MLYHKGRLLGHSGQAFQEYRVIHRPRSGTDLPKMHIHLYIPCEVFCMATDDMGTKFVETFINYIAVALKPVRTVDNVARVQMHSESHAIDSLKKI